MDVKYTGRHVMHEQEICNILIKCVNAQWEKKIKVILMPKILSPVPKFSPLEFQSDIEEVYFSRKELDFGVVSLGSLLKLNCNLCNSSKETVTVLISDPPLPYIVSCNEITLQPSSYAPIAFRFLPVLKERTFGTTVYAQFKTSNGKTHHMALHLTGCTI